MEKKLKKVVSLTLLMFLFDVQAFAQKIVAREVIIVDEYQLRQDETLCRGIAISAGNKFLETGVKQNKVQYCQEILKKSMVFPASKCSLSHMTRQCLEAIDKTDSKKISK